METQSAGQRMWFYAATGLQVGPVDEAAFLVLIASAQVRPETFVWREGLGEWMKASMLPELEQALANAAPARERMTTVSAPPENMGNAAEVLIPYRNGPALMGYYCAVFALIPVVGLLLAPVAMVLGYLGRRNVVQQKMTSGIAHAWVAMILGGFILVVHIAVIIAIVISAQ